MKVSVIMAACNQGQYLKDTVESAQVGLEGCKDWEIVIIDDGSTDGCCDLVEQTDRIQIHRPPEKLGVSHARHLAGELATGDVIITTDSHMFYKRKSLYRMAHWASRLRAIICPPVDMQSGDVFHRAEGGVLDLSRRGMQTNRPRHKRSWPTLFGSVYLMRRDVWEYLGGWLRLPGYWGGEEPIMSTVAYRFGVPIVVLTEDLAGRDHTVVHRQYRQHNKYPWPLPQHHPAEIAYYIHAACFPETYESVWKPMLDSYYAYVPQSDPSVLRDWIETRAVWSEHRFFETVLRVRDIQNNPVVQQIKQEGIKNGTIAEADILEAGDLRSDKPVAMASVNRGDREDDGRDLESPWLPDEAEDLL